MESACILQKHFPELLSLTYETNGDVLYSTDFSMSLFFSSSILHSTHFHKKRVISIWYLLSKLSNFVSSVKVSRGAQLANNVNLVFHKIQSLGGIKEEEKEEKKEKVEWNLDNSASKKEGSSKGTSSWNDMPKFLLAGAVSTIASRTFVAPLERIKLECIVQGSKQSWIQAFQYIWISEGVMGFWKGNMLNLFRMIPFKSINFICYDMYCDSRLRAQNNREIRSHDRLIAGGISGMIATILCLPLDTIRTRLIAPGGHELGGVVGCFFHMIHNEGLLSLYKGLTPALISMGPASAVFYAVYDILKASHLSRCYKYSHNSKKTRKEGELGVASTLLYGAIAGACAETITYPLEVVRRQLQLQRATRLGLMALFVKMIERDGVGCLFAGLVPSTLQVLPSAALSYLFYEMMKAILKIG